MRHRPSGYLAALALASWVTPHRPFLWQMPASTGAREATLRAVAGGLLAMLVLWMAGGWGNPLGDLVATMMLFAVAWNLIWALALSIVAAGSRRITVQDRKNRLKTPNLILKTGENPQKSLDSGPILDENRASELFGGGSVAFIRDLCELVRHHGIEGVAVVTLHQGVVRTSSTGVHPVAREHAKALALQLAEGLSGTVRG
jgi:hypothetical protein